MSKVPRLPSIINRFIEEKWLQVSSSFFPEHDSSIPDILDQSKLITPFKGTFSGVSITDGAYSIPAISSIALPQNATILVTEWTLHYKGHLELEISRAELLPESRSFRDSPIIAIEHNPSVAHTLRKFKFAKIQHDLAGSDQTKEEEELSIMALILKGVTENSANLSSQPLEELSQREVDVNIQSHPEVQIGFGQNSHKKAEEFSKSRVKPESGQDLMSMLGPEIIESEPLCAKATIELSYDIGIDVFPSYALEYLKSKYKVK
jgi:hypothetical protein